MCPILLHSVMNENYSENKDCIYCLFVCDCILSVSWGPFKKQNVCLPGHEETNKFTSVKVITDVISTTRGLGGRPLY